MNGLFPHRFAFVVLFALMGLACGSPVDEFLTSNRFPIVGGNADKNPAHGAVVGITGEYNYQQFLCSGTLIHKGVVLTAGHCVNGIDRSTLTIYFGDNVSYPTSKQKVSEVKVHDEYDPGNMEMPPLNDIALLRLSEDASLNVTPIPFLPKGLAVSEDDVGELIEFVGFGVDENYNQGVKLTASNGLDWICTEQRRCWVGPYGSYPASRDNFCQDQEPGGPCMGDSGGPAFITRNGIEYVAGITSFGDERCEVYGCSTKVDAFEKFISDFIGGVIGAFCSTNTECDSGFCEDGVCCQSSCQGECMACDVSGWLGVCHVVSNGTPCSDDDLCNGEEVCWEGSCQPGDALDCNDQNECTQDDCDPSLGCVNQPVEDGNPCPNQDVCDGTETCQQGVCRAGAPLECDDHNLCTQETCDPALGCKYTNLPNDTSCSGGICGPASCKQGLCVPEDLAICEDDNPCTRDSCDREIGCVYEPVEDLTECGYCRVCMSSSCVRVPDCVKIRGSVGCSTGGLPGHWAFFGAVFVWGVVRRKAFSS